MKRITYHLREMAIFMSKYCPVQIGPYSEVDVILLVSAKVAEIAEVTEFTRYSKTL